MCEVQQSCNSAATELQQRCCSSSPWRVFWVEMIGRDCVYSDLVCIIVCIACITCIRLPEPGLCPHGICRADLLKNFGILVLPPELCRPQSKKQEEGLEAVEVLRFKHIYNSFKYHTF